MNTINNICTDNINDIESSYPIILREVMLHIEKIKKTDSESSLFDIIIDFCFKNELQVELVGDAIQSDSYFKAFIEKECAVNGLLKLKEREMEKW